MRRPARLGLAVLVVLLVIALGGYAIAWFIAAGRVEDGLVEWAQSMRAQNLDVSWKSVQVGGFPLAFRVELSEARLRDLADPPRGEVDLPLLSGSTRPWNYRVWELTAPNGLSAMQGSAASPGAKLTAQSAIGSVAIGGDGGAAIWLALDRPVAEFGVRLAAKDADIWLALPPHPPQSHREPTLGLAVDVRQLSLPVVPAPFQNPLDEIALGVTLMGPIQAGPPRQAAAAWRDAGGTLELDHIGLRWGGLAVTGSGTVALDRELQPEGAFSGGIAGYDELMRALVAAGRMRANDASLAKLALSMLAKPGPDGRPRIATPFTIQDGQMFLGPAKLGRAPRINWD
jgi:hypothetical protein